jgi:predicted transcriptional regulator
MKYRSRTDIVSQILQVAGGSGVAKTKIMYGAFLSHTQLNQYLDILTTNGLLEFRKGEETYKTTDKGERFLNIYNQIDAFVEPHIGALTR